MTWNVALGLIGDLAVREGSRVALLLLVEDAVLGQQQVQEERGDRRPVQSLSLTGGFRAASRASASSLASDEQAPQPQAKRTRANHDIEARTLAAS